MRILTRKTTQHSCFNKNPTAKSARLFFCKRRAHSFIIHMNTITHSRRFGYPRIFAGPRFCVPKLLWVCSFRREKSI